MKQILKTVLLLVVGIVSAQNYADYVNPFIGTGGHGHTFPGATAPFGMVQLSPDTRIDGSWDGCSGYHYSDSTIYGFSHTHLNGTGVSDYGDIMLMPTMGKVSLKNAEYASSFSHQNEVAKAGFYSVKLDKHNIDVSLTSTPRVGYHEYRFNKTGQANIVLDLNHRDELLEGEVKIINDKTIEVFRRSKAWAIDQYLYARIELSKPMKVIASKTNGKKTKNYFSGTTLALALSSNVKSGEVIQVKVALSPVSYEGARKNMQSEGASNDFNKIRKQTESLWNKELSKIEIKSDDKDKLTIFYTALYHLFTQPNIYQDVDGKYRGRDNKIHTADFDYYTVFSLWDTYRGAHPLLTLIDKKRTADFVNTFIKQYEQGGRIPVWELAANETECMIGYHGVSVIADAMMKGIKGFDYEKAYEAAKNSAMKDIFGLDAYKKQNYIAVEDEHESVSKTIEYAYDDWCIAQMAKLLGKISDYQYFMNRSQNWKNLYNPKTGHLQPRKNGGWLPNFDPREVNNHFTEANSWQYSFGAQHDAEGMIALHGGKQQFENFLDALFNAPEETTGRKQVDITGLMGQYAHGNEPSHHIAYLYNNVGKPEKTDAKIRYILDNFYKNTPDGLIGNEDCGQMSAWYILSTLGIYNIAPGQPLWSITMPYFEEAKIHLENGRTITITPNTPRATLEKLGFEDIDLQINTSNEQVNTPIINSERLFENSTMVSIEGLKPNDRIFYAIDNQDFTLYTKPFEIDKTTTIRAFAERNGGKSSEVKGTFHRRPNEWSIEVKSRNVPQYTAGKWGLIDGIKGDENWKKGDWVGFQGQNFEAIIDLKSDTKITELSARFLQDSRSWILMPKKVEFYTSDDSKNFTKVATIGHTISPKYTENIVKHFAQKIKPVTAKYVKVIAYTFGKLPEWHQGFGGDAHIFIDEIEIK